MFNKRLLRGIVILSTQQNASNEDQFGEVEFISLFRCSGLWRIFSDNASEL